MIIILIIAISLLLVFIYLLALLIRLRKYNESPLSINTFDGSNSPYHPSVKYKQDGFGGYEYIMVETPFFLTLPSVGDNYRDQFECPSIHYSHDGIHWLEIGENPIDNLTSEERRNKDYFSDPDLVETTYGIECWYRLNRRYGKETNQENILLLRKISKDGIKWGEREVIADLQVANPQVGLGKIVISQSVLYEDGKYKCWYVDDIHLHKERICYSESSDDTRSWSDKIVVKLNGPAITPWHLHVLRDGDTLWLTIYDHHSISLWKGTNEAKFEYVKTLVCPCGVYGSFYSNNTYRACLTKVSDNLYRLYFSADDMFHSYIGLMEGESPLLLRVVSVDAKRHIMLSELFPLIIKTKKTILYKKYQFNKNRMRRLTQKLTRK